MCWERVEYIFSHWFTRAGNLAWILWFVLQFLALMISATKLILLSVCCVCMELLHSLGLLTYKADVSFQVHQILAYPCSKMIIHKPVLYILQKWLLLQNDACLLAGSTFTTVLFLNWLATNALPASSPFFAPLLFYCGTTGFTFILFTLTGLLKALVSSWS